MIAQHKLVQQAEWMDLKALQRYACLSERTLRDWIHLAVNPLPAVQVEKGKLLVKRSQFDRWLEAHPYRSSEGMNLERLVNEVITDMKAIN